MPGPLDDIVERALFGVVAVINGSADIQAITGRATKNVTAWSVDATSSLPVIVYKMTIATQTGSPGDTRHLMFLFSAIAETESEANALLGVLDRKTLWAPALAAQSPPVNGFMFNPVRRGVPWDSDIDQSRADLEMTLEITE